MRETAGSIWEARLRQLLSSPGYVPMNDEALTRYLDVPDKQRTELRTLIRRGLQSGAFVRSVDGGLLPAGASPSPVGTVRVRHRQLFFVPDLVTPGLSEGDRWDIRIDRRRCMGCLDGDRVRVSLIRRPLRGRGRSGGRGAHREREPRCLIAHVEDILERKHESWIGIYGKERKEHVVYGDGRSAPRLTCLHAAPPEGTSPGMLVCVEPENYGTWNTPARGRVTEVLGWPGEASVDEQTVIRRYSLHDAFPSEVLQEVQDLPEQVLPSEVVGRDDWSRRCVVTIDPEDARDYDDAISLRRREEGGWELAVHIADVSHYVRPGSATDREALRRGNSTYLPGRVLPMLPPALSEELCSLAQGKLRLTVLCLMQLDERGKVQDAQLRRAVICSKRRLAYPAVQRLITAGESVGDEEVDAMLLEAAGLAKILRRQRFSEGSLDIEVPELHILMDEEGRPIEVQKKVSDEAHSLVEEFMLLANEQVALFLRSHSLPAIYRVHEEPPEDKWRDFASTLHDYGISASPIPSRREVTKALQALRGHPDRESLQLALLRSMMRARYDTRPLGHFGLAKADYCHFTSPIRRYADLAVHRVLCAGLYPKDERKRMIPPGTLAHTAQHLSETERTSAAAENEAVRLGLLRYLELQSASDSPVRWHAVVCGVWTHGAVVDVPELLLRGYIPASSFTQGSRVSPYSRRGRRLMPPIGTHLDVVPVAVEWENQDVCFKPVDGCMTD